MGLDFEKHENARETTNSRSIVLCFDGTNNEYGKKVSSPLSAYLDTLRSNFTVLLEYQRLTII